MISSIKANRNSDAATLSRLIGVNDTLIQRNLPDRSAF